MSNNLKIKIINLAEKSNQINKNINTDITNIILEYIKLKTDINDLIKLPKANLLDEEQSKYFIINIKSTSEKATVFKNINQLSLDQFIKHFFEYILKQLKKPKEVIKGINTDENDVDKLFNNLPTNEDINKCLEPFKIKSEQDKLRADVKSISDESKKQEIFDRIDELEELEIKVDFKIITKIEASITHFFKNGIETAILCNPFEINNGEVKYLINNLIQKKEIIDKENIYIYKFSYLDICNLNESEMLIFINISNLLKPLWHENLSGVNLNTFAKKFKFPIDGNNGKINNIYELYIELKYYIDKITDNLSILLKQKNIKFKINDKIEELNTVQLKETPLKEVPILSSTIPNPPNDLPKDTIVEYTLRKFNYKEIFVGKILKNGKSNGNDIYTIYHKDESKIKNIERKYVKLSTKEITDFPDDIWTNLKTSILSSNKPPNALKENTIVEYKLKKEDSTIYVGKIADNYSNFIPHNTNFKDDIYFINHADGNSKQMNRKFVRLSNKPITAKPIDILHAPLKAASLIESNTIDSMLKSFLNLL